MALMPDGGGVAGLAPHLSLIKIEKDRTVELLASPLGLFLFPIKPYLTRI